MQFQLILELLAGLFLFPREREQLVMPRGLLPRILLHGSVSRQMASILHHCQLKRKIVEMDVTAQNAKTSIHMQSQIKKMELSFVSSVEWDGKFLLIEKYVLCCNLK